MDPLVVEDLRADPARYPQDHQMISAYPSHVLILIQKAGSRGIRLIRLSDSLEDMIQNDEDHRMQRCNQQGPAPQSKHVFLDKFPSLNGTMTTEAARKWSRSSYLKNTEEPTTQQCSNKIVN